ncbi:MAG: glycosyltransferase family 2 protein [Clostridia bacterium]|nr:glycosyltransferase family 2 protein [Clostridia bacterium]
MKRIGVLIACYNGQAWLPGQIASLQAQDDPCWHVVWQDDGSTDETPAMLAQLSETDTRFHPGGVQGAHLGAIGNFLSLMAQDDSDYSALCDQDDVWESDRLSRCRQAMERAERQYGADTPILVHSDCRVTDAEGKPLRESFFDHQGWDRSATGLKRLLVQNNVTGCTVLMNAPLRRLVTAHGRPEQMVMHDWFIALTAAAFGHVVTVDAPLVNYRQHGTNVKGASRQTLAARGVKALSAWEKGKARIALTYRHAEAFRDAYGDELPPRAKQEIGAYLATEKMRKIPRVIAVQRMGYTMQSVVTRAGQIVFG